MKEQDAAFTSNVADNYERFLGPLLFEPYAEDLVRRLPSREALSILETACGTGIVTARLRENLPNNSRLVATDLNEGMLSFAKKKLGEGGLEWAEADAMSLPFADNSFDVVVCQFGMMFVPEKLTALKEAHRVLKPGGKFLFNVWDQIEKNELTNAAHRTIVSFFEHDPLRFFETPFGFYDRTEIRRLLTEAGFHRVTVTEVELESVSPSAAAAARGLVQGTPIAVALAKRDPASIPRLTAAVEQALGRQGGERPCRGKMRALVWESTR